MKKTLLSLSMIGGTLAFLRSAFARSTPSQADPSPAEAGAVERYIEEQMQRLHIPGASIAIVAGDRITHYRGIGQACPGGEPPSLQTPFLIGSITKSFTALAVMQLVEAGQVELDTPVQHYLPWFQVAPPKDHEEDFQVSARLTVRHLLNQTSGLPMAQGMVNLANFDQRPDAMEHQARALSTLSLSHMPGDVWEYSNLNYNLLGLVVEVASGEKYEDYIKNHIFKPLEMNCSYTSLEEARKNGLARGYRHWFSLPFHAPDLPVPKGSLPSGWLISSAEDLAHYLIAHLNQGRYGDVHILSETGMRELHRGVKEYYVRGKSEGAYGMGWFDIDIGDTKTFSHGGNVPEFSGFVALIPEQKKGIVILFNADPYVLPPVIAEVGLNATVVLAGQKPSPIQLNFIQWIMRLLPLIPLLQISSAIVTLRHLRRRVKVTPHRQFRGLAWTQHILLPSLPNLTLATASVYLWARGLLRYFRFYHPDLYWITLVSGVFAGVWTVLRTVLIARAHRSD